MPKKTLSTENTENLQSFRMHVLVRDTDTAGIQALFLELFQYWKGWHLVTKIWSWWNLSSDSLSIVVEPQFSVGSTACFILLAAEVFWISVPNLSWQNLVEKGPQRISQVLEENSLQIGIPHANHVSLHIHGVSMDQLVFQLIYLFAIRHLRPPKKDYSAPEFLDELSKSIPKKFRKVSSMILPSLHLWHLQSASMRPYQTWQSHFIIWKSILLFLSSSPWLWNLVT